MPLGDALIALLHSLQAPSVLRMRHSVRRAAQPLVRVARRRRISLRGR